MSLYYSDEWVSIHHGDSLEILPSLPDSCADSIVTDPPYKISQEYSANADPDNLLAVAGLWPAAPELYRLAKPGALCAMFYDTRIMPLALRAMRDAGWKYLRHLTFYRAWGVAHKLAGWMSKSDYILLFAKPGAAYGFHAEWRPDTYVRSSPDPDSFGHPAQKPLDATSHLVRNVTPPGGLVLDPWLGVGTTAVVARAAGLCCVGIELEERYCEIAAARCSQEVLAA